MATPYVSGDWSSGNSGSAPLHTAPAQRYALDDLDEQYARFMEPVLAPEFYTRFSPQQREAYCAGYAGTAGAQITSDAATLSAVRDALIARLKTTPPYVESQEAAIEELGNRLQFVLAEAQSRGEGVDFVTRLTNRYLSRPLTPGMTAPMAIAAFACGILAVGAGVAGYMLVKR